MRYYYAALHNYDIRFINDVTTIVRFTSKSARDEWVDAEVWDGNFRRESVTRDKARRYVPKAFREFIGFSRNWWANEGLYEIWSESDHWTD